MIKYWNIVTVRPNKLWLINFFLMTSDVHVIMSINSSDTKIEIITHPLGKLG